jgi:hypothetical protein
VVAQVGRFCCSLVVKGMSPERYLGDYIGELGGVLRSLVLSVLVWIGVLSLLLW